MFALSRVIPHSIQGIVTPMTALLTQQLMSQETRLQIYLACHGKLPNGNELSTQELRRLVTASPPNRLFFERHRLVTALSLLPSVFHWEEKTLRRFVVNYLRLEHELAIRVHLTVRDWRKQFERKFEAIIRDDQGVYHELLTTGASVETRIRIGQILAKRIIALATPNQVYSPSLH